MGQCSVRGSARGSSCDMPPPYIYNEEYEIDKIKIDKIKIDEIKYITKEKRNNLKNEYNIKSIEHRMKTIDDIDKLILEAANKGYNILDYDYIEPNDSNKHNFFIELRNNSIKYIINHYKSKKYKMDYYIYTSIHKPVKLYIKW